MFDDILLNSFIGDFNNNPILNVSALFWPKWIPITQPLSKFIIGPPEEPSKVVQKCFIWQLFTSIPLIRSIAYFGSNP